MSRKNINIPILIILIMAFFAFFVFYDKASDTKQILNLLQNRTIALKQADMPLSSAEIAGWKTYENTKYGYSIRYPADWEAIDITNEEVVSESTANGQRLKSAPLKEVLRQQNEGNLESIITLLAPDDIKPIVPKKGPGDFWISGIRLDVKKGKLEDEVKKYAVLFTTSSEVKGKLSTSKIGELNVVKIEIEKTIKTPYPAKTYAALMEKGGMIYRLTNDAPSATNHGSLFNQILSTFKFTQ